MRYYSEETVKKIMEGVKVDYVPTSQYDSSLCMEEREYPRLEDYPSVELSSPWHTGTPTEIGNYIAHLRIKSRNGEFIEYDMTCNLEVLLNYIRCQDESEENYLMVKGWLRYEPYKEGK